MNTMIQCQSCNDQTDEADLHKIYFMWVCGKCYDRF